jgi:phage tail sheath protein FI
MPEYLHPGVYIEEIERGPKPIEGVPTSTAAFLGETERGPITPQLVTSYPEYHRGVGGDFDPNQILPYAANGFFENGGKRLYICRIVDDAATQAQAASGNFFVRAVGPGSWGRRVWVRIEDSSTKRPNAGGNSVAVGFRLRLAYWANRAPFDWIADQNTLPRPSYVEDFDDLVTDEKSPDYWEKRLLDSSALATLVRGQNAALTDRPPNGSQALAQSGVDGAAALDVADYQGLPAAQRTEPQGLEALKLDPYREVALVYAPGVAFDVAKAVITHCENLRYRFAVVDCQKNTNAGTFEPRNAVADTQYAALYYPWIVISDPESGARKTVPPGGHALGIFARTDAERGVFKAPANEIARGVLELSVDTNDATQDVLNPRGINAIREFPGRGIRVWGARTLSSDALWRYVPVRRLFIFLELSIYEGTQWLVF